MWYLNTDKTILVNLSLAQAIELVKLDGGNARVTARMNDNTTAELFTGDVHRASDVFLLIQKRLAGESSVF